MKSPYSEDVTAGIEQLLQVDDADAVGRELVKLERTVERQQDRIDRLESVLKVVGRSVGVSVGGRCSVCGEGILVESDRMLACTNCGTRRYVG